MKIIRTYILKQLFFPFLGTFVILTFVMVIGGLTKLADLIINKEVNVLLVAKLFLLQIPSLICYTLPFAVLTCVLLVFGRLSQDNEINSIRTAGINLLHIITAMLCIGLIISAISLILNDKVLSSARYLSRVVIKEIGIKSPSSYLEEGQFIPVFDKYIFYVHKIKKNKLYQIRIYEPQENGPTRTVIADEGEFTYDEKTNVFHLFLTNGTSEEPDKNNPGTFYKLNFKKYSMSISFGNKLDIAQIEKKPKDMNLVELQNKTKEFQKKGINPAPLVTEFYKKIALSFAPLVFILFGLPIAIITHRKEKSIIFGLSLIIATSYYLLMVGVETLCMRNVVLIPLCMFTPNLILCGIGGYLMYRIQKA